MYEYKVKLPYKVESCQNCTFKHENIIHEDMQSSDKISGVVGIIRRSSLCMIKNEPISVNEVIVWHSSRCPLKGNITLISDKE